MIMCDFEWLCRPVAVRVDRGLVLVLLEYHQFGTELFLLKMFWKSPVEKLLIGIKIRREVGRCVEGN